MRGRGRKADQKEPPPLPESAVGGLKQSVRKVRIELAERSSVVVDLRDAELARLELLNEALDPLFGEIPVSVELFDRGISQGDTPRLWIDVIAHVAMGRDKRRYQFMQDTRYGRKILAESTEIKPLVDAVTHYVASRLVERERALISDTVPPNSPPMLPPALPASRLPSAGQRRRGPMLRAFLLGLIVGGAGLFAALWIAASRIAH